MISTIGSRYRAFSVNAFVISLILVSIAWLDRPLSLWVHRHSIDSKVLGLSAAYRGYMVPLTPSILLAAPAEFASLVHQIGIVGLGLALTWLGRLPRWAMALLASCIATSVALDIKEQLKWVFGRTWPDSWAGFNPSWIRDGAYGFHFFHGGVAFESFPSGHAAAITSFVVPLSLAYPKARIIAVLLSASTMLGLLAGNYHFLSDVIAGGYLGVAVGMLCSRLVVDK